MEEKMSECKLVFLQEKYCEFIFFSQNIMIFFFSWESVTETGLCLAFPCHADQLPEATI